MDEYQTSHVWWMRFCFCLIAFVSMLLHLLPFNIASSFWVAPEFLMAFAFAWSVRRPDFVPTILLASLFLLSDLLLQRPPGLWALLLLLSCEYLKVKAVQLRSANFLHEWVRVLVICIAIVLATRLVYMVTFIDQPSLGLQLIQILMTIFFYPIAVFISYILFGVHKAPPGDLNTLRGQG